MRTFREYWLPVAISEPAIFHQLLASVAIRIRIVRGEKPDNIVSVAHHSLAIRSVNRKLADSRQSLSDNSIFAILILTCYSVRFLHI